MIIFPSLKQIQEDYKRKNPPDFITHLNYVYCFNELSKNLKLDCRVDIKNKIKESKYLIKKIHLIELLRKNLQEEHKLILGTTSFAEICVPWITVKSYYLIFNLLLVLEYLITSDEHSFSSSHEGILKKLKMRIKNTNLVFNKSELNKNYKGRSVLNWKAKPHANIKIINPNNRERFFQIIKILMRYRAEEFKRKKDIKTLNCKEGKDFLDKSSINICEFFYWYRIKSNYRDLEFLDKKIDDDQFLDFYQNYFNLTENFRKAYTILINDLSVKRLGKEIL